MLELASLIHTPLHTQLAKEAGQNHTYESSPVFTGTALWLYTSTSRTPSQHQHKGFSSKIRTVAH